MKEDLEKTEEMKVSPENYQKAVERQKRTEICLSELEVFFTEKLELTGSQGGDFGEEAAEQKN